jgi:hypothetical protein
MSERTVGWGGTNEWMETERDKVDSLLPIQIRIGSPRKFTGKERIVLKHGYHGNSPGRVVSKIGLIIGQ